MVFQPLGAGLAPMFSIVGWWLAGWLAGGWLADPSRPSQLNIIVSTPILLLVSNPNSISYYYHHHYFVFCFIVLFTPGMDCV